MNIDDIVLAPQDGQVTSAAVAATASAATVIPYISASGGANRPLTIQAVGTDTHIIFGTSSLANPTLTTNSLRLVNGTVYRWTPPVGCTHFKTIGVATGVLLIAPGSP